MLLKDKIMKLQTYKMFAGEDTVYVERDDILKLLEQEPCEDAVSKASVFEILGNLMSIPYDFDRQITEKDVSESMDEIRALPPVTPKCRCSEKPNKSIEEKCPCYYCEHFEIKGWSHCKIHEGAYGDSRCNDYHKVNQDLTKVKQGSNKSEIPTSSITDAPDICVGNISEIPTGSTTKNDCTEQNGCTTCSLDDGDDCCRKLYEESMQEPSNAESEVEK